MIPKIEDAIIARIKSAAEASPGLGYRIPNVVSYGGELDDLTAEVVRQFPAVWVTYAGGGKPQPMATTRSKWRTPATFSVVFGARNIRGERSTRHGVTVAGQVIEVGAYQMLEDISLLLLNQDLGLPIDYFKPGAIRTLYNTKLGGQAVAVFVREFHTAYIETEPREAIDPSSGDFLKVGISYYLQPDTVTPLDTGIVTLGE
jgi:phage gp37-like protein